MSTGNRSILKTIDRALRLLQAFTVEQPEWGVTELSKRFGWDKSVTQRMLSTLESRHFIQQSSETKKYRLGMALLGLAEVVNQTLDIRKVCKEHMRNLVQETGESVILTIVQGDEALCIDALDSSSPIKYSARVGTHFPPHVGAGAKALFAFKPPEELAKILAELPLDIYTPETLTTREAIFLDFEQIRKSELAISLGEKDYDVCAVGVPLRNRAGEVVAAVTIVGPQERVLSKMDYLQERLRVVQREISGFF